MIKDRRSKMWKYRMDLDLMVKNKEILICINSCIYDSGETYFIAESNTKINSFNTEFGPKHKFYINDIICLSESQCEIIGILKNNEMVDYIGNNYLETGGIKEVMQDVLKNFVNLNSYIRDNKINNIFVE